MDSIQDAFSERKEHLLVELDSLHLAVAMLFWKKAVGMTENLCVWWISAVVSALIQEIQCPLTLKVQAGICALPGDEFGFHIRECNR